MRLSLNQGKPSEELSALLELDPGLQMPEYSRKFTSLLHIEELQMEVDIRHYDMEDASLTPEGQFLVLKVIALSLGLIIGNEMVVGMEAEGLN